MISLETAAAELQHQTLSRTLANLRCSRTPLADWQVICVLAGDDFDLVVAEQGLSKDIATEGILLQRGKTISAHARVIMSKR